MEKETKTYEIYGRIRLVVTSDSDKEIEKAIKELNQSLPYSDLISANGAIQQGRVEIESVKEITQ